ncbi:MAG: hypothetical protein K9M02_17540 [Thiohalocapsa sp.]|nr:hypothetical protein [Thiohalocapsa sp.]
MSATELSEARETLDEVAPESTVAYLRVSREYVFLTTREVLARELFRAIAEGRPADLQRANRFAELSS